MTTEALKGWRILSKQERALHGPFEIEGGTVFLREAETGQDIFATPATGEAAWAALKASAYGQEG